MPDPYMEFKLLDPTEKQTFLDWADHYFTEHIWSLLAEAKLWHPVIRRQLLTRIEEALSVDPMTTRMVKDKEEATP